MKISKDSWILISILAGCILFSGILLSETFRWVKQAQMPLWIAAPVAKITPLQQASLRYNGLIYQVQDTDNEIHLQSFDYVWKKINESYWEEDFGGVDWEKAKQDLRPKVEKAKDINEVRQVINELIERLGKSHFAIIPASLYEATNIKRMGKFESGITFRFADGKILVSAVRSDCPAYEKGVRPGWQIKSVADQSVEKFLERARSYKGVVRFETIVGIQFGNLLTGKSGAKKDCVFLLPNGEERSVTIGLVEPAGDLVKFGNLPEMRIDVENKLLGSNVGYFRFNGFFDPVRLMPEFRKAVKDYQTAEGLIIDLRGNGGGLIGMTMGMASPLAQEPAPLGVMKMKGTELKLALFKNARPYTKKIAVLVDETSASASEIYSGGLQDLKIARVFGRRTAGLSLPSAVEKLPNGDGFQYAFANYTSASGKILEGNGVVPDEVVELSVSNLSKENDPTLKRAVEWIVSETK